MRILLAVAMIFALAWPPTLNRRRPSRRRDRRPRRKSKLKRTRRPIAPTRNRWEIFHDQPPADPWGNARSTDTPKTAAKTAAKSKPGAKTPAN